MLMEGIPCTIPEVIIAKIAPKLPFRRSIESLRCEDSANSSVSAPKLPFRRSIESLRCEDSTNSSVSAPKLCFGGQLRVCAVKIAQILRYLRRNCVSAVNGTEFTAWYLSTRKTLFEKARQQYGAAQVTIPPRACTDNSMVEASHRLT